MPNILNTENNLNPVKFSFNSSNSGIQKRQTLIKARESNIKEKTEYKSDVTDKQDSTQRNDRVSDHDTEQDFKKTLIKKSDSSSDEKPFIEKIEDKDLEEGVQDLIQAIISMIKELSSETPNKVESNLDKAIDIDISSSAISDLLQEFSNTIKLEDESSAPEKVLEIVNQFLNSESFTDLKSAERLDLAQELNTLLSGKIDELMDKISDSIRNTDLGNLSLKEIDLDNDHELKLSDKLQNKLESIIQLGERSETLDTLKKMSDKLAKALDSLEKGIAKLNQNKNLLPDDIKEEVIKLMEPKLDKLLDKYNAEIIEDPSLNSKVESELSLELDSSDLENFSEDSSSQEQAFNNHLNLLSKNTKIVMKGTSATKINVRMKAAEFLKSLPEMVKETPVNSSRELKIRLNPESLGTVDVSITKNANQQLSIQLTVSNDGADKVLRQKVLELTASLAEKGVAIEDINISKSEGASAGSQEEDLTKQNSFNEASEKQKKQQNSTSNKNNTETSKDQRSFQNELLGILKT